MTSKEYLNRIRSLDRKLRIKEQQLQQLHCDIGSLKNLNRSKSTRMGGKYD